jgi:hypothetical protein
MRIQAILLRSHWVQIEPLDEGQQEGLGAAADDEPIWQHTLLVDTADQAPRPDGQGVPYPRHTARPALRRPVGPADADERYRPADSWVGLNIRVGKSWPVRPKWCNGQALVY